MFLLALTILRPSTIIDVTVTQAHCSLELLRALVTKDASCQCALCFGWGQPIHVYLISKARVVGTIPDLLG